MSTITTIQSSDLITDSRAVINTNFSNLNTDKMEASYLDTDTTLAANSDTKIPSQKAIKAYVDAGGVSSATGVATHDMAAEDVQTIAHGLGRTPSFIKISAVGGLNGGGMGMSVGTFNGTTNRSVSVYNGDNDASSTSSSTYIVQVKIDSDGKTTQAVATLDATNITLTWTKVGGPTGTSNLLWEAY